MLTLRRYIRVRFTNSPIRPHTPGFGEVHTYGTTHALTACGPRRHTLALHPRGHTPAAESRCDARRRRLDTCTVLQVGHECHGTPTMAALMSHCNTRFSCVLQRWHRCACISSSPRRGCCSVGARFNAFQASKPRAIALTPIANATVKQLKLRRQRMLSSKSNALWCCAVPLDDARRADSRHSARQRRREAARVWSESDRCSNGHRRAVTK